MSVTVVFSATAASSNGADGKKMPVPVALIPDRDIPPDVAKNLVGDRRTEGDYSTEEKQASCEASWRMRAVVYGPFRQNNGHLSSTSHGNLS